MKIVILDGHTTTGEDLDWQEIEDLAVLSVYEKTEEADIVERAKDADILITNKTPISAQIIASLPNLRFVSLLSTGCNIIDLKAAREKGISVSNVPAYSTNAVAQHTFALLLELTNSVGLHADSVRNGEWSKSEHFCYLKKPVVDLYQKRIGLVGFGAIAKAVYKIASSFGMSVSVYTRNPKAEKYPDINFISIEELLKENDVISLHIPLTSQTENFLDKDKVALLKEGAYVINTARGSLIDEYAVTESLNSGKIGGYGADVLKDEPPKKSSPLLCAKNTVITPHIAWASKDSRKRLISTVAENIKAFINGSPQNVVN